MKHILETIVGLIFTAIIVLLGLGVIFLVLHNPKIGAIAFTGLALVFVARIIGKDLLKELKQK